MGVRDYLDKNQDLDRDTFLQAVRRQLDRIRPAKRERRLHQQPGRLPRGGREGAAAGAGGGGAERPGAAARRRSAACSASCCAPPGPRRRAAGAQLRRRPRPRRKPAASTTPRGSRWPSTGAVRALAGRHRRQPAGAVRHDPARRVGGGRCELQPFERGRRSLLAAPLSVAAGRASGAGAVRQAARRSFTEADRRLVAAAADFGAEMLRQALAERQTHQVLFDAVGAALGASESVAAVAARRGGGPGRRSRRRPR